MPSVLPLGYSFQYPSVDVATDRASCDHLGTQGRDRCALCLCRRVTATGEREAPHLGQAQKRKSGVSIPIDGKHCNSNYLWCTEEGGEVTCHALPLQMNCINNDFKID